MTPELRAGAAGLGFGAGLLAAGMTRPDVVRAFLDPWGGWQPALALTLAGAAGAHAIAWIVLRRRGRTRSGEPVPTPPGAVDRTLIVGAAVFGVGWGLGGVCPGPALVGLGAGDLRAAVFVASLLVGFATANRMRAAP